MYKQGSEGDFCLYCLFSELLEIPVQVFTVFFSHDLSVDSESVCKNSYKFNEM